MCARFPELNTLRLLREGPTNRWEYIFGQLTTSNSSRQRRPAGTDSKVVQLLNFIFLMAGTETRSRKYLRFIFLHPEMVKSLKEEKVPMMASLL
jgi:hypothetical protein